MAAQPTSLGLGASTTWVHHFAWWEKIYKRIHPCLIGLFNSLLVTLCSKHRVLHL